MKSILLIGLSHFGELLAHELHEKGHEIMAVDREEARVNAVLPYVTDAQIGDSTNEAFLKTLGIGNYDICFVAIGGDFQNSLETTSLLKELGARQVISCADREVQAKFLLRNGADEVIHPEKQIARWAAVRYGANHLLDYIKLDDSYAIYEVDLPKDWAGRTVEAVDVRHAYDINILAIKQAGQMRLSIRPDTVLEAGQTLLVLGEEKAVQRCFRI